MSERRSSPAFASPTEVGGENHPLALVRLFVLDLLELACLAA